jgi:hypothetical protein
MEQYYFIEKNGAKLGPFKLSELKQQTISFDELIWRSDSDQWRKAADYEELSDIFIIKPPPTPKEQKIAEVNRNFTSQIIVQLVIAYFITSLLIGSFSSSIAQSSWDEYLKNGTNGYGRYKTYIPEMNVKDHEDGSYWYQADQTGFWFYRPFKAFGSTIYLSHEEQDNSSLLREHLMLSSFVSLSILFLIIGIIYYAIKRTDLAENPAKAEKH